MRTHTLLGFLCGATIVCLVAASPEIFAAAWQAQVNERLDKLESTVAILKRSKPQTNPQQAPLPNRPPQPERPPAQLPMATATSLIKVQLSGKRFQDASATRGVYEDAIWWDSEYTPTGLKKPTRAVKGVIEFADLFGEVKFGLKITLTNKLRPGRTLVETGDGFVYNQFRDSHKWMRATAFEDMKITFRVESIIYSDGTTEQFSD